MLPELLEPMDLALTLSLIHILPVMPRRYYLEYNSTIRCSAIGVSMSSLLGIATTLPSNLSTSTVIHEGTVMDISLISLNLGELWLFSFTCNKSQRATFELLHQRKLLGLMADIQHTVKTSIAHNCQDVYKRQLQYHHTGQSSIP